MLEPLLESAAIHTEKPGVLQPEGLPRLNDGLVNAESKFGRGVKLESELTYITDPLREHHGRPELDLFRGGKAEALGIEGIATERAKQFAGTGPHNGKDGVAATDVSE